MTSSPSTHPSSPPPSLSFQLPQTKQIGNYTLGSEIGSGAFGKVFLGTHILTSETVAIKILDKLILSQTPEDLLLVQKEISILKIVKHKHIAQLYEIMETPHYIYIIMEYCEGKDLMDYILTKTRLTEMESLKLFQQLISALLYLHNQNIAHRDIKIDNILLDAKMNLKLVDFGLSTKYSDDELLKQPCGTVVYAAPEVLEGREYHGMLVDVWSSGIVLYGMISGYLPFCDMDDEVNKQSVLNGDIEIPEFFSDEVKDLLGHMLDMDEMKRYTLQEIQEHEWFNMRETIMLPGIVIGRNKIPIDERILNMIEAYDMDKEAVREKVKQNKFDAGTAMYYLLVKKAKNQGFDSVSDLASNDFIEFILDENNYIEEYDNEEDKQRDLEVKEEVDVNDEEIDKEEEANDDKGNEEEANDDKGNEEDNTERELINNKSRTSREGNLVSLVSINNNSVHSINKKNSYNSNHNDNNDNNNDNNIKQNENNNNNEHNKNEVINILKPIPPKDKNNIKETPSLNNSFQHINISDINKENKPNNNNNNISITPLSINNKTSNKSIEYLPPKPPKLPKSKNNKLNKSVEIFTPIPNPIPTSSTQPLRLHFPLKPSKHKPPPKQTPNTSFSINTSIDNSLHPKRINKNIIASLTRPTKSSTNKRVMHIPMTDRKDMHTQYRKHQPLHIKYMEHTYRKDTSIKAKLLENTTTQRKNKVVKSMSIPNDVKKHQCITHQNSKSRTDKQIQSISQQSHTKRYITKTSHSISICKHKKRKKYTKEDILSISNRLYTSTNRNKESFELSKLNVSTNTFNKCKDIKHLDSSVIQTRRNPSPIATRDLSYSPKQAILNEKSRLQKLPWKYKKNGIVNNENIPDIYKRYQDNLNKQEHSRIVNLKQYNKNLNMTSHTTLTRKSSFHKTGKIDKSENNDTTLSKQVSSSRHNKNQLRKRTNTYYNGNNNNTNCINKSFVKTMKKSGKLKRNEKGYMPELYIGPIDVSCILEYGNVKECVDYVKRRMEVNKVQYYEQDRKGLRFYCMKNGSLFDVEIKRIQGYKKEEIVTYLKIRERQGAGSSCRKFIRDIFG